MLRTKRFIFIIFIFVTFQSCKTILKATGNYQPPQPETVQSIKDYMDNGSNYNGLYRGKSDTAIKYFTDSVGHSVPFVYVFDHNMQNVYKSKTCPWSNVKQLDSLKTADDWHVNQQLNYKNFSKYLTLADGRQLADGYDYAIFFVWAKFVPKLSKEMLMQMDNQFKTSNGKVYIGSVNLDFYKP